MSLPIRSLHVPFRLMPSSSSSSSRVLAGDAAHAAAATKNAGGYLWGDCDREAEYRQKEEDKGRLPK